MFRYISILLLVILIPVSAMAGDWETSVCAQGYPVMTVPEGLTMEEFAQTIDSANEVTKVTIPAGHATTKDMRKNATPDSFPTKLDYRDINGVNYIKTPTTAIDGQSNSCGSCMIWSATAVMEAMVKLELNFPPTKEQPLNLSEQYMLSCYQNTCNGNSVDAWNTYKSGIIEDTYAPNLQLDYRKLSCPQAVSGDLTKVNVFKAQQLLHFMPPDGKRDTLLPMIRSVLNNHGPFMTTLRVFSDFNMFQGSGIYTHSNPEGYASWGLHAVAVIGYNDEERYIIIKNSWGTGWGDYSFAKISYDCIGSYYDNDKVESFEMEIGYIIYTFSGIRRFVNGVDVTAPAPTNRIPVGALQLLLN